MSMGANDPRGGTIFDPRGIIGRIYKEDNYTLLYTKYESSKPCSLGEEDFFNTGLEMYIELVCWLYFFICIISR